MSKIHKDPNIVAYTQDGIPLPALPWSDKPEHALGRRRMDEANSESYAAFAAMATGLGIYESCRKQKCRRLKKCNGLKIQKSGRRQGLYEGFPACFADHREPVRDILREVGLGPGSNAEL